MSASLEASLYWTPVSPPPIDGPPRDHLSRTPIPLPFDRAQLRQQLRIIQDMLKDLEEQTVVGRRHTMHKLIAVLRDHIGRGLFRTGPRNLQVLLEMVDKLTREAARPLPEVRQFRDHAEPLVALLMATT